MGQATDIAVAITSPYLPLLHSHMLKHCAGLVCEAQMPKVNTQAYETCTNY